MHILQISNGIKLICYPLEHAKSIQIGLYIKAGSRNEDNANNGITHLLEHMHFRQLGDMSQKDIYRNAECMGTSLRGTTYKEMINFSMKIRPQYFQSSLLFFENTLTTINWTKEQFENEKKIVLNELYEKEDELEMNTVLDNALWSGCSLSRQGLGNEEVVGTITLENVIDYKKEIFCGENIALVITGAVDDAMIKYTVERFEKISLPESKKLQSKNDKVKELQFKRKPNIVFHKYSARRLLDVQISFDVDLKTIKEDEILFLNSVIGGGDGSVLQKQIREDMGLVYDIHSFVEIYKGASVLSIVFSIDKDKLYVAIEKIVKTLKSLSVSISQIDIDMNKVFFTDNLWYWTEDSSELNFQLGYDFVKDKEVLTIEERIKENEKIDCIRLQEICNAVFKNENLSIVVMGSTYNLTKKAIKEIVDERRRTMNDSGKSLILDRIENKSYAVISTIHKVLKEINLLQDSLE